MPKTTFLFVLAQFVCSCLFAQSARSLVASAGNTDATARLSISWSLGDIATATAYTQECDLVVAEGFQQTEYPADYACPSGYVDVNASPGPSSPVKIYPNPVESRLMITTEPSWKAPVSATVRDAFGRVLLSALLDKNPAVLDFQSMAPAWYYLTLTDGNGAVYTLKVIKQ
ncbi:MAG: T9SS type A sorting domain-containing protein [Saprospiraceae bacterium]|nr:T9SS type A sorting domain-containing protein [Saprospiraceae bacterium]